MTTVPAQGPTTGNPGIVPPWLQGGARQLASVAPAPADAATATPATRDVLVAVPTGDGKVVILDVPDGMIGMPGGHDHGSHHDVPRRGFGSISTARRGANVAAEQRRIDETVQRVQAKFAALGITDREGNSPVHASFVPNFPNAAYAPEGLPEFGMPRDSIGVGFDPRSGRSFAEAEDVVAHELAHRVIDHMTRQPLSMHPMSEDVAVHESLADTFAALVDDDQEWVLGEDLAAPVRIMDRPERLGHPGHVDDLKTVLAPGSEHMVPVGRDRRTGEVVRAPDWHVVAGIPNKAAAIIGATLGKQALGEIYIDAVRKYVQPGKEIEGLAAATMRSAADLFGAGSRELQVTRDAWDAVGVLDLVERRAR